MGAPATVSAGTYQRLLTPRLAAATGRLARQSRSGIPGELQQPIICAESGDAIASTHLGCGNFKGIFTFTGLEDDSEKMFNIKGDYGKIENSFKKHRASVPIWWHAKPKSHRQTHKPLTASHKDYVARYLEWYFHNLKKDGPHRHHREAWK